MKWKIAFMALALVLNNFTALAFDPCMDTINHTPRADVVYGGEKTIDVPDPVEVPLTIDIAQRYGIDVLLGADFDTSFGTISIYKNGDVFYNSEDISQNIKDKCENDSADGESEQQPEPEESQDSDNANAGG